jgi:hypothetical protein
MNARMLFPTFFPGNLSGSWVGGQFVLDQAITVLRIAATAKTPSDVSCVPAVFRFTDGTKGQDVVLPVGQQWSDTGPITLTFAAGATLQASLRSGASNCLNSNFGADTNLLVEYKMQAAGDTDSCFGVPCSGICTPTSADPANCGSCGTACSSGKSCISGACGNFPSSCMDGVQDGTETDVDCGGGTCTQCAVGKGCQTNTDCTSNACDTVTHKCVANLCLDQIKDGTETDVDCGGGTCPACPNGLGCQLDSDCTSNACDASTLKCVANQCFDNRKDGAETDIDCGGGVCSACGLGKSCQVDTDCTSNACDASTLKCVSNQCADNRKDGTETGVDCGGPNSCARCGVGQGCLANSDCQPGLSCSLSLHVCQ